MENPEKITYSEAVDKLQDLFEQSKQIAKYNPKYALELNLLIMEMNADLMQQGLDR